MTRPWVLLALCAGAQAFVISPIQCDTRLSGHAPRSSRHSMAGFGSSTSAKGKAKKKGASAKPAKAPLSPKVQWDRYKEHRKSGIEATTVYARVIGSDAWLNVGDVTASSGADVAGAVQLQKRLILEHAVRVHPQLLSKARDLEAGFILDGATQPLTKVEPVAAAKAGFVGRADASGRYGKTEAEISEKEPSSLQAATKGPTGGKTQGLDSKGRLE